MKTYPTYLDYARCTYQSIASTSMALPMWRQINEKFQLS